MPAVVLWEISRLEKAGEIRLREPYREWADVLLAHPCFECAPLDEAVIAEAREYSFTRDLFDAAVVATARLKDVPLITKDQKIVESGIIEICW